MLQHEDYYRIIGQLVVEAAVRAEADRRKIEQLQRFVEQRFAGGEPGQGDNPGGTLAS